MVIAQVCLETKDKLRIPLPSSMPLSFFCNTIGNFRWGRGDDGARQKQELVDFSPPFVRSGSFPQPLYRFLVAKKPLKILALKFIY